jgi:hypothetical protein
LKSLIDLTRKLFQLTLRDVIILFQAWVLLLLVDPALRLFPFSTVVRVSRLTRQQASPQSLPSHAVSRLVWLVEQAGRCTPGTATCLRKSLVLSWLLARRGISTTFRIGVARQEGTLRAHAWLERHGQALVEHWGPEDHYPLLPTR